MTQEFALAKITALSQDVEEEVTLNIDGITVVCFAANRPAVKIGEACKVQLKLFTASDYGLAQASEGELPSIKRIGTGFGYYIVGKLASQGIVIGSLTLLEESFASDYAYLMDELVSLKVDRIGARFLRD